MSDISYTAVPSSFGELTIVWRETECVLSVLHVYLSGPGTSAIDRALGGFPGASLSSSAEIEGLADGIRRFLSGQDVAFDLSILALERCSEYQATVQRAESRIPRGYVSTYGRIARSIWRSKGARAVGGALACNPSATAVPCHRAIRSDGQLGGYQGGLEMKRALLEMEGIAISPAGRVLAEHYYY
ncbi:MAG: methylated-DNA--[protein]-cysteine S-methyltransferase [Anaerolineae bacterium]|jgi:methylated-DNA-[protein]-cysteine S-methyltransferase